MALLRIVSFCFLMCNFQVCLTSDSASNDCKRLIEKYGEFYCLRRAVEKKSEGAFNAFLENGANKYAQNKDHFSVMSFAIKAGWVPGVKSLIALGYDVNRSDLAKGSVARTSVYFDQYDHIDETPLMKSIGMESYSIAKIFVSAGADINARNFNGNVPLDYAMGLKWHSEFSSSVQPGVVKLLVDHGAKIELAENKYDIPAILAQEEMRLRELRNLKIDIRKCNEVRVN